MNPYEQAYAAACNDPESFWAEQAAQLIWYRTPTAILQRDAQGHQRWFANGQLNTCYLAVDAHVEQGRGAQTAIIYDSPVTGVQQKISYAELQEQVARCAGMLRELGVGQGDRVIIYMPMIPQALTAMLACARLGVIHSVVFGGFSAAELAVRIDDAKPKLLVTASCGIEVGRVLPYKPLVDKALSLAKTPPQQVVLVARAQCEADLQVGRDHDWDSLMQAAPSVAPVAVAATDPLYILYTSGTTGKPKGVVRDNGGHAVALNFSMSAVFDAQPGEVFWAASDIGWVVGHSYIVYAPLLRGCTTLLYEGKPVNTPDAGAFWRVIGEHRVKVFFTAPTAFRAIRREDPDLKLAAAHDLSCLKAVYVAGERLDPSTYQWLHSFLPCPVVDHWWQTETGWPIVANPLGLTAYPTRSGSATLPVPGFQLEVLDDQGQPCATEQAGNIVIKLPLPPGTLLTLWQDDARYVDSYLSTFPGYYLSGDGGYRDQDGYVFVMGRIDDVINVAGHRLSSGALEEVLGTHPAVAECAVVGLDDALKGEMPVGFVVLKQGAAIDPQTLQAELVQSVREAVGAVASLRRVHVLKRLPKTRSGKILRKTIRALALTPQVPIPATIEDATVLDELRELFEREGCYSQPPRERG
ncbi:propionyl-CoA synthetase [Pseudomonas sp. UL073]|uniref:Propionyl-CoA synthetase n=1 Tax=Zestomonas insulae TaxID=2809017 RepID=A0ABS2IFG8_9GAMM|nr:propionyl-CoA synthetase [Pseudomonas insulae]MBM7061836.1 propionyl-CoA synthetase [Pseudomonas insulae]